MIKELWEKVAGKPAPKRPKLPRKIQYVTFRIENDEAAKALFEWDKNHRAAYREVNNFVQSRFSFSLFGTDRVLLHLDEDGRLESVNFFGIIPYGWSGIPHTHLLAPQEPDAVREVDALPRVPMISAVHKIINWPTLEQKWFPLQQYELISRINWLVKTFGDGEHTYVKVPHPDNFKDFPRIETMFRNWDPPQWVKQVNQMESEQAPQP